MICNSQYNPVSGPRGSYYPHLHQYSQCAIFFFLANVKWYVLVIVISFFYYKWVWLSFHIFIHLLGTLFAELSVYILCLCFISVRCWNIFCLLDFFMGVPHWEKKKTKPLFWCNQINPFLGLMTDAFWALFKLSWQIYSSKLFYTNLIILCFICSFLNHLELIFLYLLKQGSGFIFLYIPNRFF